VKKEDLEKIRHQTKRIRIMNNELLTEFIHTELHFHLSISVKTYEIIGDEIHLRFIIKDGENMLFSEFYKLERYNDWYLNKVKELREDKLKKLGIV
jgi:hypothetical protein